MSDGAASAPAARRPGRLVAWVVLVGLLAAASYGARLAGGETPDDVLYLWSTFVGAVIQYGIMLVLVLAIAHGFDRALLATEVPRQRWRAVRRALVALVVIIAATAALSPFLDAGDEQGLVPKGWDSSRARPSSRTRRSSAWWRRSSRSSSFGGSATGS